MLKIISVCRWIIVGTFLLSIVSTAGRVVDALRGRRSDNSLVLGLSAELNVLTLLALIVAVVSLNLLRYRAKRIDELMAPAEGEP
jgi:hypothetical protein